jgi:hypothetical protein
MATVPLDDLPQGSVSQRRAVPRDDLPNIGMDVPEQDFFGDVEESKPRKPLTERLYEVGTSGGVSAALGAVSPELFTGAGFVASAFPLTAPAAPFLLGTGQALRGQRLGQAGYGFLGGLMGESAGQVVEARGGTQGEAELARFLAGTFGPEIPRQLGGVGGTIIGRGLQAVGVPGAARTATIGQMLEREANQPGSMTAEQRAFIQRKIQEIRGGKSSLEAQKEVADMLSRGAQARVSQAEQEALNLERQANELLTSAQARAGQFDATAQQRISALQSQFENTALRLRDDANTRARSAVEAGRQRANQIMQEVQAQSPQVQQIARIDADQAIRQAQQQADQILANSQQRIARMREVRDRLRTTGQQRVEGAQFQVGAPKKISNIGQEIREGFTTVLDRLRQTRSDNAKLYSQEAFGEAFQKEAAGQSIANTKAAKNAVQELNVMLSNPVSGLAGVPEGTIRTQIKSLREVLSGRRQIQSAVGQPIEQLTKPSFEQLEIIRRSLRDRASGLPAEGYDAIGQQMAGRFADLVEEVQKEFAPKFSSFLTRYKEDSVPINRFANNLAKRITGKEEADFAQFKFDPASLADNVFASKQGVEQLVETVGPERAERIARDFVANSLRNADAPAVQRFLADRKTQDWLDTFPRLEQELMAGARRLGIAESTLKRRGRLAETLGTEMRVIPRTTETAARRVEEAGARAATAAEKAGERRVAELSAAGEREAQKAIAGGEQQFREITGGVEQQLGASAKAVERQQKALAEQAERAARTETKTAEEAAGALTKEAQAVRQQAQDTANLLTKGDMSGAARVRDLIMSEKNNEIEETAKIILSDPRGKERFADAVSQVVADLANVSVKTSLDKWKYVGDRLMNAGLIDKQFNDRLTAQLQEIMVTPVSAAQKVTMAQSLLKNAIVSYAGPGVVRGVEALIGE